MGRKDCLRCKGKILLGIVNTLLKKKSLLTSPINVLNYSSSKLFWQQFEFLLKVKVMGLNPGYLLKLFLLYLKINPNFKTHFSYGYVKAHGEQLTFKVGISLFYITFLSLDILPRMSKDNFTKN